MKYDVKGKNKTVVYMLGKLLDNNMDPILSEEHTEFRWCSLPDAIELVKYKDSADMLSFFHEAILKMHK